MKVIPITQKTANDFVAQHHRHNKPVVGARFAIGLMHDAELVGVAIVGRPVARALDDGLTAEVTRCCVHMDAPKGSCSKLYAACQKAWFSMGGKRMVTYTLDSESGASLRGAGWKQAARVRPSGWDRKDRKRNDQAIYHQGKLRWEARTT